MMAVVVDLSTVDENSPDYFANSARPNHVPPVGPHNAYAVDTPKMPGEPPRCNPHVRTV